MFGRILIDWAVLLTIGIVWNVLAFRKTERDIRKWASEKKYTIQEMEWMPWTLEKAFGIPMMQVICFAVGVKDESGNVKNYKIWHKVMWFITGKSLGFRDLEEQD